VSQFEGRFVPGQAVETWLSNSERPEGIQAWLHKGEIFEPASAGNHSDTHWLKVEVLTHKAPTTPAQAGAHGGDGSRLSCNVPEGWLDGIGVSCGVAWLEGRRCW
jgi:hypothetical protein